MAFDPECGWGVREARITSIRPPCNHDYLWIFEVVFDGMVSFEITLLPLLQDLNRARDPDILWILGSLRSFHSAKFGL
jgi:hypothetical protein